ncbi:MAG: Gmad2 immunoglobulin-like domain-containing protein [Patescibacteria group bacterium]
MKRILIILIVIAGIWLGLEFIIKKSKSPEPVACTMEAKLCSDGSYVSRIPPECDFAPCPKEGLIQIESPMANETISSPLIIKGKARGFWFFEASFPIKLVDEKGDLIKQHYAQAKGDWMTEDFVPFEANLTFSVPNIQKGFLVFEKDNPSGLPENADELKMPVLFKQGREINLYYYNPDLDKDENGNVLCSRNGLVAVKRTIPITQTPIQDTIKLLLKGELTQEEKNNSITTEYPLEGFSLKAASFKSGVLTLTFNDPNNKTVGGSCRVGVLWFQIEATAKQFSGVQQVRFLPEELFQP